MCLEPNDDDDGRLIGPAIANYKMENARTWSLQRKFNFDRSYKLLPFGEMGSSFAFRGSHGSITLSAVGFNPEKNIAVVSLDYVCGSLCGGGGFTVLRKDAGQWKPMPFSGRFCYWAY
jgi:hypothetical protein